jgi:hypothetical protein
VRPGVVKAASAKTWVTGLLIAIGCSACGAAVPKQPEALPPTITSITREHPGGDAADPHFAALARQLEEPWGWKSDKDAQLRVPLVDSKNWKRVRFWAVDHFVGFRYGSDVHAVASVFIQEVPEGEAGSAAACMRHFERWSRPRLRDFHVRLGPIAERSLPWHERTVLVHQANAAVPFGFETSELTAAWAAYPAYPDGCLIFSLAVPWRDQEGTAKAVVERWVEQGLERIKPLTPNSPHRK